MALFLEVGAQLHRPVQSGLHVPLTTNNQGKPYCNEIDAVLREVVHSQAQPQDEDTELLSEGDSLFQRDARKGAVDQGLTAKDYSPLRGMRKSITPNPVNQKMESEDVGQDSQRELGKVVLLSDSGFLKRLEKSEQGKAKDNSKDERFWNRLAEDSLGRKRVRRLLHIWLG